MTIAATVFEAEGPLPQSIPIATVIFVPCSFFNALTSSGLNNFSFEYGVIQANIISLVIGLLNALWKCPKT